VMWELPTTQMRMPFYLLVERVLAVSGSEVESGWWWREVVRPAVGR
jgi:hypothetical protein